MKIFNFDEFLKEQSNASNAFFKNSGLGLKEKIESWLVKMGIRNYDLIIDPTYGYIIDVFGNVNLNDRGLTIIPYKFNRILGFFDISNNKLISLKNCPEYVENSFSCSHNSKLKSLIGGPKEVKYTYDCTYCDLRTLEGAPEEVFNFYCSGNKNLRTLEGGPKYVFKIYACSDCGLISLKGAPKEAEEFYCVNNPGNFTKEDVLKYVKIKYTRIIV